jgi:Phage integrase family
LPVVIHPGPGEACGDDTADHGHDNHRAPLNSIAAVQGRFPGGHGFKRRFTARFSGLASGLAFAVRPLHLGPRFGSPLLHVDFTGLPRQPLLAALRRKDIDLNRRTVRVERTLTQLPGGGHIFGPPKSDAGQRMVAFPDLIVPDLTWHMARFTGANEDALVFVTSSGMTLEYDNFRRRVWLTACAAAGLQDIHFHDLRLTGNQFAADVGAGLRELMDRMGHSSTRAALIYLHATSQRQRTIADAAGTMTWAALQESQSRPGDGRSGTDVARSDDATS